MIERTRAGIPDRISLESISVVIPIRNEEQTIRPLYEQLTTVLQSLTGDYEILFLDDGSTDSSAAIMESLWQQDSHVKALQLRRNFGKAAALAVGFAEARGDIVLTLDGDLQDDPQEIPRLVDALREGYDVVSGWKRVRHDPLSKTAPSRLFNWVVSRTTGIHLHDFNCGFKAYRREVVKNVRLYGEMHRFIPVLAHSRGYKVTELPVTHHPRKHGKSKYGIERLLRGFFDLLTILFLTRYLYKPLHFFGALGLLTFLVGFGIDAYLAALWFAGVGIGTRPLLSLGTLLLVIGMQLICTGLIAELMIYLKRDQDNIIGKRLE
ncbi:MAG TPA: glycosyltransferase family 2 protein [Chthonomonadaceae bacterium]|nr:glycosyltransferase family 2 protein [Chthonomonadaceae bacterium]